MVSNKWKYLPLVIIMLLGFYLRVVNINQTFNWWDGDTSRDILTARHIAFMGESSNGGPSISGGLGYINNSPLYYYFLALIYRIWDSYLTIPVFFALFDTMAIWVIFLIGRRLVSYPLALIMAAVWAVNNYEASLVRISTQPMILPVITVLVIYFLEKAYREKRIIDFCGYIFFLLFSLQVHYAELSLFPVFIFFGLFVYWKNKFFGKLWYIPVILVWGMFGGWIWLTYRSFPFDQIALIHLATKQNFDLYNLMVNLGQILQQSFVKFFYGGNPGLTVVFWLLAYVGMGYKAIKSTFSHDKSSFLLWLLFCLMISVIVITVMGGGQTTDVYYTHPFEVLWIIGAITAISPDLKNGRILTTIFSLSLGIVILVFSSGWWCLDKSTILFDFDNGQIAFAKKVAQEIKTDSGNKTDFDIIHYEYNGQGGHNYGPSAFWYFVEKEYGKKLVKIANDGNHNQSYFVPLEEENRVYFVCSYPVWSYWQGFEDCEKLFLASRKEKKYMINMLDQDLTGLLRYKLYKYQPM